MTTIEDTIAEAVCRRLEKVIDKKIAAMEGRIIASIHGKEEEERLLAMGEAQRRLKVNAAKLRELIAAGDIQTATPPGCRTKVLASSINKYVRSAGIHGRSPRHAREAWEDGT